MKRGIRVYCDQCNRPKVPHGRSVPAAMVGAWCDETCRGYLTDPRPGCLWPDETSQDFGYIHCDNATEEAE